MELVSGISISNEMFFHNSDFRDIISYSSRVGILINDLLSYNKEALQASQQFNILFYMDQKKCIEEIKYNYSRYKEKVEWMSSLDSYKSLRPYFENLEMLIVGCIEWSLLTPRYNSLL